MEGDPRLPTDTAGYRTEKLKSLLGNLPQLGIRYYIVGTKEGLSVLTDSASKMPDPDLLSAATATMLSTSDFVSEKYKEGVTKEIVVRVEGGYILIFRVGANFNFSAITGEVSNLEYYMDILRKYANAIEEAVVSPEEEVSEAEGVLRKELEMIGISADTSRRGEPDAKLVSQVRRVNSEGQKGKRPQAKLGKEKK